MDVATSTTHSPEGVREVDTNLVEFMGLIMCRSRTKRAAAHHCQLAGPFLQF